MKLYAVLQACAKLCAILAGLVLLGMTLLTLASVVGRYFFEHALNGDFEMVAFAAGAAVALCMPWCQVQRSNIIVDFFTTQARVSTQIALDRFGALLLAAVMGLMAWRSVLGGLNAWNTQSGSMMLGVPEWIVYASIVPPLSLTALIALVQAVLGIGIEATPEEKNPELSV